MMATERVCKIEGCGKRHNARGLCRFHYERWKRYGDPEATPPQKAEVCTVTGCSKPHIAKGFCTLHYRRAKSGVELTGKARTANGELLRWLEAHVDYDGDNCLIWPYGRNRGGYGVASCGGKRTTAHRIMCRLKHGDPEQEGWQAAHSCGNGHLGCVNPRHLKWATVSENNLDKTKHGTATAGERNPAAKLSDDDVRHIRRMKGSVYQRVLADQYGVEQSVISGIWSGKTWRNVK